MGIVAVGGRLEAATTVRLTVLKAVS